MYNPVEFSELLGKTLKSVEQLSDHTILFTTIEDVVYKMFHLRACCETVTIEDVCGDLQDLVGEPILLAEEVSSQENPEGIIKDYQDSYTWTFYKLATRKGYVDIRWYGESNGYYSECVDFVKVTQE